MGRSLMKKAEVVRRTALSESTIRRLVARGQFPKPVQLTDSGSVGWFQDEVDTWIESRQILTPELQRKVAPGTMKRERPQKTQQQVLKGVRHESN